ncbi:MAG: metal-dependent transcriptional regulator [Succinivibrionaceae bacterium]
MQESGENYLETILLLEKKLNGKIRAVDLAKELSFSKPSVSRAVGILKTDGYLTLDEQGGLHLTEAGRSKAEMIYERHVVLTQLFEKIANVSKDIAEADACRIEHVISNETFYGLKAFISRLNKE